QPVEAEGVIGLCLEQLQQLFDAINHACQILASAGWYAEPVNETRSWLTAALACALLLAALGCASNRKPPPRETVTVLRITQHVGGTHYRMLVHEGQWYQTFGTELLVLDTRSARLLHSVELGPIGATGPAVDMLAL